MINFVGARYIVPLLTIKGVSVIIHTEGIVLKSFDYRETSKIVTFFTYDNGKVSGVMKGIRKDPKKFGSSVDRFSINHIVYYEYRSSDLHLISHCDLKEFFFQLRNDYRKNIAAHYVLELVNAIMPVEHPNTRIYELMVSFFRCLENEADIDRLICIFQIKMLLFSGFRPHIDSCVRCGKKIDNKARFSMKSGGLICPHCPTNETTFSLISRGAVSSMLYIESRSWKDCLKLGLTKSVRAELKFILNNFLVYHLEKRIKTLKWLNPV